jgi:hypothetical protein
MLLLVGAVLCARHVVQDRFQKAQETVNARCVLRAFFLMRLLRVQAPIVLLALRVDTTLLLVKVVLLASRVHLAQQTPFPALALCQHVCPVLPVILAPLLLKNVACVLLVLTHRQFGHPPVFHVPMERTIRFLVLQRHWIACRVLLVALHLLQALLN